jgi:hypothetical protein
MIRVVGGRGAGTGASKHAAALFATASTPPSSFLVFGSLVDALESGGKYPLPGQQLSLKHAFPKASVEIFSEIAGDNNPIHLDEHFAKDGAGKGERSFKGCIVPGLLVASLLPSLFGRTIPRSLYVSQSLRLVMKEAKPVGIRCDVPMVRHLLSFPSFFLP